MPRRVFLLCLAALCAFAPGCDNDDIRVETIPKAPAAARSQEEAAPPASPTGPRIEWKVPAGWTALPAGGMRYAAFAIPGSTPNAPAELTVFQFPTVADAPGGASGGDAANVLANVNRWRGQLHLAPTAGDDLQREAVMFQSVNAVGLAVDLEGRLGESETSATPPTHRLLGAILPRPDRVWFFKLTGPLDVIATQKENFDAFLRSVKIIEPGESAPPTPPAAFSGKAPLWTTPAAWQREESPAPPRLASFHAGGGDDRAEIVVTAFPGGVGKPIDNFNRWRQQIGLEPLAQIPAGVVQSFFVGDDAGLLLYLAGADDQPPAMQAMGVSLVVHDGVTFVFKLTGSREAVAREKQRFEAFVQSTKFGK